MTDRRKTIRTVLDKDELTIMIQSGDRRIMGTAQNITPDGLRVEIEGTYFHYFLSKRRLVQIMVHSRGQPVFQSYMVVRYAEATDDRSHLHLGLEYIGAERFTLIHRPGEANNLPERRQYPRSTCEIPGTMIATGENTERTLPVIISDISEAGCRVEGPENLDHLIPGTITQICLEPWDMEPIRLLAKVVKVHAARVLGVLFHHGEDARAGGGLRQLVLSLRYPDLVAGQSEDAEELWATLSASGYFRERAPETYMKLHEHAVHCWDRLNSPVGASINRTLITPDPEGQILSLSQLTQIYPRTWLAHHLAVLGDQPVRARLVPQQFSGGFDILQKVEAKFFINYHNAAHKAQLRIWLPFQERSSKTDFSLRKLLCYDMATSGSLPGFPSDRGVRIHQQGTNAALSLLPRLHRAQPSLVYDALGFEDDLELERLDLAYSQVGLRRRRCWLMAESREGEELGFASLEEVPTGFNLTSVGDHLRLYMGEQDLDDPLTCVVVRRLVHHAMEYFRRLDKPYFMLMADVDCEALLSRSLGLSPMARAHEMVMSARLFPAARDFIREQYQERASLEPEPDQGGQE